MINRFCDRASLIASGLIAAVMSLILAQSLAAQGPVGELFAPPNTQPKYKLDFQLGYQIPAVVEDSSNSVFVDRGNGDEFFSSLDSKLDARAAIVRGERFGLSLDLGIETTQISSPDNALPDVLTDSRLGLVGYYETIPVARQGFTFGAAWIHKGDEKRFDDGDAHGAQASIAYRLTTSREWMLVPGLFYSGLRFGQVSADVPFPFLEAVYRPGPDLTVFFGAPVNGVFWKPNDWLTINAFTFFGIRGGVEISEQLSEGLTFAQFGRTKDRSWRSVTPLLEDSTLYQQSYEVGLKLKYERTFDWGKLEASGEYAFRFGHKWQYRNDDDELIGDPVRVADGHLLGVNLKLSFGLPSFGPPEGEQ